MKEEEEKETKTRMGKRRGEKGSHTLQPKGVAEDPPAWGCLGLGVSCC